MDILSTVFFYILTLVTILCILGVVFSQKTISAVLFGLYGFVGICGIYFMLNATFNAATLFLLSACATILLILTVIITAPKTNHDKSFLFSPRALISAISLFVIFATLTWALVDDYLIHVLDILSGEYTLNRSLSTVYAIGEKLLTDYALAFELFAVMLFVLIIGIGMVCVIKRSEER